MTERPSGWELLAAVELMDRLRRDGPWEREQTHESLRRYLVEETYELLDAIDSGDRDHLLEELGDILLQVLFHARIAADRLGDPFDIDDVARAFTTKISARTQGVLSGNDIDLQTQLEEWETRKAAEKARGSVLDGIATGQPALALAQKVLERLAAAGFPDDLVPDAVRSVRVVADGPSVEDGLRAAVLRFMADIRVAEAAGPAPRTPEFWRTNLPR
ncbi:MazG family protein [Williamsia muralis]|uniref:MazG family protein n=1 Tax=Williamsia marianensis TaxID=85044 RepID=UPI000DE5FAA7|nr:MazG-like nucleotide pyrophosphohydrolase family protein [Williamsia marianensis]